MVSVLHTPADEDRLFAGYGRAELEVMAAAGAEVMTCQRVLAKTNDTLLTELLRHEGEFHPRAHYPVGDVYDPEYHAQYYFHAHPAGEAYGAEYGHFHTFLRPYGMPDDVAPADVPDDRPAPGPNEALSHLIGISVDGAGQPLMLFTTNRWVTGETWYEAADVVRMLPNFAIDHARPSWVVNRWITAMVALFRPQIERLLRQRDEALAAWRADNRGGFPFEVRTLEMPSHQAISVPDQVAAARAAVRRARRAG